ncbi:hypothetical protein KJ652_03045 [Patescibacteria group bacterium]|nr:hypothetical protein [Patescibacteria group bacterium]
MMDKSNRVISASKERHEQKIAHILESPLDPELDKDTWKYLNWERKELDLMIQKHNNEISCYGYDKETPASEYKPIPKIPAIQWPETAPP